MPHYLRKILILIIGFSTFSIAWYFLHKVGFVPPINYFFSKEVAEINSTILTVKLLNYQQPIKNILTKPIDKTKIKVLIEKSQYRLTVYYQNQPIKSYPVVFGDNPTGDKLTEGDRKTPEGIFKVRDLYPHNQWSKFIWLDYPNHQSWQKHLQAKKSGKIPIFASIGSEIGIHGVNQGRDNFIEERNNWTWGCISLKNQDVDEVYSLLEVGNMIEIVP